MHLNKLDWIFMTMLSLSGAMLLWWLIQLYSVLWDFSFTILKCDWRCYKNIKLDLLQKSHVGQACRGASPKGGSLTVFWKHKLWRITPYVNWIIWMNRTGLPFQDASRKTRPTRIKRATRQKSRGSLCIPVYLCTCLLCVGIIGRYHLTVICQIPAIPIGV